MPLFWHWWKCTVVEVRLWVSTNNNLIIKSQKRSKSFFLCLSQIHVQMLFYFGARKQACYFPPLRLLNRDIRFLLGARDTSILKYAFRVHFRIYHEAEAVCLLFFGWARAEQWPKGKGYEHIPQKTRWQCLCARSRLARSHLNSTAYCVVRPLRCRRCMVQQFGLRIKTIPKRNVCNTAYM